MILPKCAETREIGYFLFLLMMDLLLKEMERKNPGSILSGLFVGATEQVVDVRTITNYIDLCDV